MTSRGDRYLPPPSTKNAVLDEQVVSFGTHITFHDLVCTINAGYEAKNAFSDGGNSRKSATQSHSRTMRVEGAWSS